MEKYGVSDIMAAGISCEQAKAHITAAASPYASGVGFRIVAIIRFHVVTNGSSQDRPEECVLPHDTAHVLITFRAVPPTRCVG